MNWVALRSGAGDAAGGVLRVRRLDEMVAVAQAGEEFEVLANLLNRATGEVIDHERSGSLLVGGTRGHCRRTGSCGSCPPCPPGVGGRARDSRWARVEGAIGVQGRYLFRWPRSASLCRFHLSHFSSHFLFPIGFLFLGRRRPSQVVAESLAGRCHRSGEPPRQICSGVMLRS